MTSSLGDEDLKLISDLVTDRFGLVFPASRRAFLETRLRPRLHESDAASLLARSPGESGTLHLMGASSPLSVSIGRASSFAHSDIEASYTAMSA